MEDENKTIKKNLNTLTPILVVFLGSLVILGTHSIFNLKGQVVDTKQESDNKISILQEQLSLLENKIVAVSGASKQVEQSLAEVAKRQTVKTRSQEEIITGAVARVAPSVVSIIATKDVPKVEVIYQNPFGDDPFWGDMDIRVPVLRQRGVEPTKVSAGTGLIVTSDGFIVTNKHVVSDTAASYTVMLPDGTSKNATVLYRDDALDVAVLKVAGSNFFTAPLGNSSNIKLGQTVIAIGNALGEYNNSVSVGIVSGLDRKIEASTRNGVERLTGVIQTDAAINPGNSGGPLVNADGEVVGINVATVTGTNNISFSIPINALRPTIENVIGKNI
ncbi:MAG: hypothetical protein A3H57_04955 [Candidatus Taylorbacteria bacterium RIFCSPLOWO2_02_FULL_43_11]|uniref:Serine protease n=1 Tax=Candidatus Taylorbacteria bacterium RIFCSPHIGHO2_02_FULL_43_32b TaxID=1802306 RepID=A0A1G2MKA4_9BACT|nr:MAG: hypothetical protein A2743_03415 [Candidatus Taylorbacteria bacterium RIFCSPHIGHO2_01_FULL_43_47]OHA24164.1 MAG: hypothetical protein A3C72_03825 [Candidatus Taylorbacteria bacterium RIFCSPHIGHO2_02_FULL_43_32b]OHA31077.1 MAG: hypothetical protein A3B08_01380 [Candidatus Taylorbacteria bacterium RIFCSPLOWO2_01_FULL_43_44]OHA37227.1 MAG: hypothetical protein A3H57_04955 [Candidatus Taylorbacteria bacterium RIFCSPLOWO2_02_FULL_43_11]